ncbi:peptidase S16 [Sulfurifustis variabilis]|uniref:Peptidase S16 n=1 Tax=Sulfurifustis variabilis TaxID=1675686 RepID=A0A1B4V038_9GAMM|nr:LON peptidase substrate-binding domain-containing protein [Sulfurifustis variabilis]BAU46613.1 peptidase S16 [Sulfurifustis variabilis]
MTSELPIFPLNAVLFPGGRLAVRVFEKRYVDMVTRCMKSDRPFGVCLIKKGEEVGAAAEPHPIGTLVQVAHCDMDQPGILEVVARGTGRIRLNGTHTQPDQLVLAEVETLPEGEVPVPERHGRLVEVLKQVLKQVGDEAWFPPARFDDAGWLAGRLTELLPLPLGLKQALLELDDPVARLDVLAELFPTPPGGNA